MVCGAGAAGFEEGVREARERGEEWTWLVDAGVEPAPDALERLLEHAGVFDSVLLASRVVGPGGRLDPGSLPVPENRDLDLAVAAYERHLVALRVARRSSLLVHRRALVAPAEEGDLAWTAALLRTSPGLLVPDSVVVRTAAPRRAPVEARARLRLIASDALDASEKPWFAFRLMEDGLARLRKAP